MKVVKYYSIKGTPKEKLLSLPCVQEIRPVGNSWCVILKDNTRCSKDDYLVKFESGIWQRFGAVAFQNLNRRGESL